MGLSTNKLVFVHSNERTCQAVTLILLNNGGTIHKAFDSHHGDAFNAGSDIYFRFDSLKRNVDIVKEILKM